MEKENRKCENCGRKMPRASYIPFNGGMIVCVSCFNEWERLGEPKTISDYHQAIYNKEVYENDLIVQK